MNPTLPSQHSLQLVAPELCLVLGMCFVLITPFIHRTNRNLAPWGTIVFLVLAAVLTFLSVGQLGGAAGNSVFAGMLMVDYFSQTFKILLYATTLLVVWQWLATHRDHTEKGDQPDFLCLILGAAFGMSLMASASNLLMIFMAMEAASFPSYALAGFRKTKRSGAEASLKYVVFGSAASAIMVYGMSMIYGIVGSLDLASINAYILSNGLTSSYMLTLGILAVFAGVAFKLSAAPLHFWCPDVFQSAPTAVTTFLSVASKGAAICLLLRVLSAVGIAKVGSPNAFTSIATAVAIMGAVTALVGTVMAVRQTHIKRLLAFSSIAHAGYMIMAASLIVLPENQAGPQPVAGALLFYLVSYAIMNVGAFSIVSFVSNATGAEDIRDYAGLSSRSPLLAGLLTVFLLSLFGMPTLGGFMGKMYIASIMANAGYGGFILIAVMLLCTVASLYFYMKPVYYMFLVEDKENRPAFSIPVTAQIVLAALAAGLFFMGLQPHVSASNINEFSIISAKAPAAPQNPTTIPSAPVPAPAPAEAAKHTAAPAAHSAATSAIATVAH